MEPRAGRPLRARARRGRRHARRGRSAGRVHRRPHRARAQGQVRGPRAPERGPHLVGRRSTSPSRRPTTTPSAPGCASTSPRAPNLYVIDAFAGADPAERLAVRVVSESAWHALFAQTMFIVPSDDELLAADPEALILHAPTFTADPATDGTRATNFVSLHLTNSEILIGGTEYAGEIKKSIFTLMNDRLPNHGVLSMHCSANVGADGRVAVFFGLSGTGKTTLSTDSTRPLIGDDEHGWGEDGVFNIEGGCYAKVINLSPDRRARDLRHHPHVRDGARERRHGPGHAPARPRRRLQDREHPGRLPARQHPQHGRGQARRPPVEHRDADRRRLRRAAAHRQAHLRGGDADVPGRLHGQGGGHRGRRRGAAGHVQRLLRRRLPAPAAVGVRAAAGRAHREARRVGLAGQHRLDRRRPTAPARACRSAPPAPSCRRPCRASSTAAPTRTDPIFGFEVPTAIAGVDSGLLDPRSTWADKDAYDASAKDLAARILEHAAKMTA